ncbi:hypothetical protein EVG20_g386 [Dentipellis fragilis]|uniref:RING-type domain-containing protein n=1 Tax=Dentipellis fragilis TaxID=205917 RepID=A0A4Y9ZDH6_9AGAM|nr:hypothetical protein EVG20_g386 [Dentipellis fragilis]
MESNNNGNADARSGFSFHNLIRGILQQSAHPQPTNTTNQDSSAHPPPLANPWDDIDRDSDVDMPPLASSHDEHDALSDTSIPDMIPAFPMQPHSDTQRAAVSPSQEQPTSPARASYAQEYNLAHQLEPIPSGSRPADHDARSTSSMPDLMSVSDSSEDESERDARDVEMHLGVVADDGDSEWTDESIPHLEGALRADRRHVAVEEVPDPEDAVPHTEPDHSPAPEPQPRPSPPPRPQGPRLPNFGQFFGPQFVPMNPGSGGGQGHGQQPTLPNFADFIAASLAPNAANAAHPGQQTGAAPQAAAHDHEDAHPHADQHNHQHQHPPQAPDFPLPGNGALGPMITLSFEVFPGAPPAAGQGDQAPAPGQPPPGMPIGATAEFNGGPPVPVSAADLFALLGLPIPPRAPNQNVPPADGEPVDDSGADGQPGENPVPNGPTQQDYFRGILQFIAGLVNAVHPEPERDDPDRARRLIAGLDPVSEGLVQRIERVAKLEGDDANGAGCAICWEPLLEDDEDTTEVPLEWTQGEDADGDVVMDGPTSDLPSTSASGDAPAASADPAGQPKEADAEAKEPGPPLPKIVALPCSHIFHSACLIPWFSRPRQTTCPTCRFNIDPEGLTRSIRPLPRRAARPAGTAPQPQPQPQPQPPQPQQQPQQGQPRFAGPPPFHFFFEQLPTHVHGPAPAPAPQPAEQGVPPVPTSVPAGSAEQNQTRLPQPPTQGPPPAPGNAPPQTLPQFPRAGQAFVPLVFGGQGALFALSTLFAVPGMQGGQPMQGGPQPQPQPQPHPQAQQAEAQDQPQPQQPQTAPNAPHPPTPADGPIPFNFPPAFAFRPLNMPPVPPRGPSPATNPNPNSNPREKRPWAPPPAPGPSLRQRVEARERDAGLRCDDVTCGIGPSDEDPVPELLPGVGKMIHVRPHQHEDGAVCAHKFHPACLVVSERVAGWGQELEDDKEKMGEGEEAEVEVSCPVCRAVGVIPREEWEEGARASA